MDVSIQGINAPREFKKVLLWAATMKRNGKSLSREMVDHLLMRENAFDVDDGLDMAAGLPGPAGMLLTGNGAGGNNAAVVAAAAETNRLLHEMNSNLRELVSLLRVTAGAQMPAAVGGHSAAVAAADAVGATPEETMAILSTDAEEQV